MANYNPYENMLDVLDRAAEVLGYKKKTMLLYGTRNGSLR